MISFSLYEIASILNAKHVGLNLVINTISTNSNIIHEQCMFVALVGKRFDGHNFVLQAVTAGAKALLVNHYILLNVPQLVVADTYCAFLTLAHWVRSQVTATIVAVTGSSGKTSVKEMTTSILNGCGYTIATHANFNNMIGVPITLLRLTKKNNFAVIELGSSCLGEIARLSRVIAANIALVNNLYPSHLSGFGSLTNMRKEKGEIFSALDTNGVGVINVDSNALYLWRKALQGKCIRKFSICTNVNVDFFASNIISELNGTRFILHTPYGIVPVFLSMLGSHNVSNALAASALAFSAGAKLSEVVLGLENTKKLPGRLFPIILSKGKVLLDDTYNSNIGSMISAIRVLMTMPGYRVLVVSDMLELGRYKTIKYHCYIGKLIAMTNINEVLTIGSVSYFITRMCGRGKNFQNKKTLITYIKQILYTHNTISILVKGSRAFKMDKVVTAIRNR